MRHGRAHSEGRRPEVTDGALVKSTDRNAESFDDARSVRTGEQLDWKPLEAYLRERLAACRISDLDLSSDMQVAQFPGGHSNLTYLVRFGDRELVMRRPPFGPVAPTAHDMAREFRWLSALHPVFPLAPRPYLLCDDPAVVGSIFYVMERRRGVVVRHEEPADLADRPDARRRASEALVDTLADLHALEVAANGLGSLGKPAGFVERQVRGWTERWHRARDAPLEEMDALAEWLRAHLPPDPGTPSVVHGDFKLDNVMFDAADPGRVVAVLDWEMTALGDPLVDLGILVAYWTLSSPTGQHDALSTVTNRPGWLARDDILARYRARSGRDLAGFRFYEIFAMFKVAVVIQQIFHRYTHGLTDDARFAELDKRVAFLAHEATNMLRT